MGSCTLDLFQDISKMMRDGREVHRKLQTENGGEYVTNCSLY